MNILMDKSPDAFKTISEVAEELDLPQHVLRFWETRFSQIKLIKRGGGRRYYRPADVDLLRGIQHFLYGEGYTIKGLQRILKEEGTSFVQAVGRGEVVPSTISPAPLPEPLETPFQEEDSDVLQPPLFPVEPKSGQGTLFPMGPVKSERLSAQRAKLLKAVLDDLKECERVLAGLSL